MTDQGLFARVREMTRSAIGRVLTELAASPVLFIVVIGATAISYDSLRQVAAGVGLPAWATLLFPLTLDVAAYPALRIALSKAYGRLQRAFGTLVGLGALVGSVYGNLADHLRWAEFGHPSVQAIYFVSVVPPVTIGSTLLLTLFVPVAASGDVARTSKPTTARRPKASAEPDKAPEAQKATPEPLHLARPIDQQMEWVRKEFRRTGTMPRGADVDKQFSIKSRNGHRAVTAVVKEMEAHGRIDRTS